MVMSATGGTIASVMREAQLGFFDTSCIEWAERGFSTDYVLWFAFESSSDVTDAAIVEHLQHRVEASPVLNRRLCVAPRRLDYPYWVYGIDEVGPLITVSPESGLTWDDLRPRLVELLDDRLDLAVAPLRMQVFRNVTGLGPSAADVVAVTMSHALMSGRSTGPFAEYLFAPRLLRWRIDGLPPASVDFRPWRAALRSTRMLGQVSGAFARARRQRRKLRAGEKMTAQPLIQPEWPGSGFWGDGPRLILETRHIAVPPKGDFKVTEQWIAAIASALSRFHEGAGEPAVLPVSVPVLVPYEDDMGANNVLLVQVQVEPSTGAVVDRLEKIRDDLREGRDRLMTAETAEVAKNASKMPYVVQRMNIRRHVAHPRADVFVSSMVFRSELDLHLAGERWIAGGPVTSPRVAVLSIVLWTFDGVTTLQVSATPVEPDAVRRLTDLLVEDFDNVVAASAAAARQG